MTRKQYLKSIENNIQSLTIDEQKEVLEYYNNYFDDAGDDEKVMEELGSPEEVASQIIEKMSNVLVKTKEEKNKEEENKDTCSDDKLFFSFNQTEVKNLDIRVGASEVVVIPGKKICIETRGISSEFINCSIDSDSTLHIQNVKKLNFVRFFGHDNPSRFIPRILITIPENFKIQNLFLSFGAGRFETKDISLYFENAKINIGAGNLILSKVYGKRANVRCGAGNLELSGKLEQRVNLDCGVGCMKLNLDQNESDSSIDVKVGLGTFKFNSMEKSGVTRYSTENRKENHFSVNVGLGSVTIKTK